MSDDLPDFVRTVLRKLKDQEAVEQQSAKAKQAAMFELAEAALMVRVAPSLSIWEDRITEHFYDACRKYRRSRK